jgi:hypothetical protein
MTLTLPAAAQQTPREGEVEFTFSADVADLATIPGGADRQVSAQEGKLADRYRVTLAEDRATALTLCDSARDRCMTCACVVHEMCIEQNAVNS